MGPRSGQAAHYAEPVSRHGLEGAGWNFTSTAHRFAPALPNDDDHPPAARAAAVPASRPNVAPDIIPEPEA